MTFLPRRRLVLASAGNGGRGSNMQWPGSQMPWDAEDNADAFCQASLTSSQIVCKGHGDYVCPEHITAMQSQAQQITVDKFDQRPCSQSRAAPREDTLSVQPEQAESQIIPPEIAAALGSLSLPAEEYTELYWFLTKGSQTVQPASAKEKALYKLTDLRQVCASWHLLLLHC